MYRAEWSLISPGQAPLLASLMQFSDQVLQSQGRSAGLRSPFRCGGMAQSGVQQSPDFGVFLRFIQGLQGSLILWSIPSAKYPDAQFPLRRLLGREQSRHLFPPAGAIRQHLLQLLFHQLGTVLGIGQNLLFPGILTLGKLGQGCAADFPVLLRHPQIGLSAIYQQGKMPSVGSGSRKGVHCLLGAFRQILPENGKASLEQGLLLVFLIGIIHHQAHHLDLIFQPDPGQRQALEDMFQLLPKGFFLRG